MSGDQLRALMRERDALAASTTYQIEISPEEYAQLRHATLHNRRCFGERDNLSNNELVVDPALSLVMGKCAAITDAEWRRRHPDEGTEMTERSERK